MSQINEWALKHLTSTAASGILDKRAGFLAAKESPEWADYQALIEFAGWDKIVDVARRGWQSDRLTSALDRLGGQRTFGFLAGIQSVGRELKYTDDLTLEEYRETIETRRQSRNADGRIIRGMERLLNKLLPIWNENPHLTLLNAIDLIEP